MCAGLSRLSRLDRYEVIYRLASSADDLGSRSTLVLRDMLFLLWAHTSIFWGCIRHIVCPYRTRNPQPALVSALMYLESHDLD
jgi:hypothetical protein